MAKSSQSHKEIKRAGSLLSRLAERPELPRTVRESCTRSAEALAALRYDAYPAYAEAVTKRRATVEATVPEGIDMGFEG